jgi:hypothetical protein
MNRRQRITVFFGSVAIAVMLLFPPMDAGGRSTYRFILMGQRTYFADLDTLSRPGQRFPSNGWVVWRVNRERLIFQVVIAVVLTTGIVILLGGKRH